MLGQLGPNKTVLFYNRSKRVMPLILYVCCNRMLKLLYQQRIGLLLSNFTKAIECQYLLNNTPLFLSPCSTVNAELSHLKGSMEILEHISAFGNGFAIYVCSAG